jgi:nucleolar protein 14
MARNKVLFAFFFLTFTMVSALKNLKTKLKDSNVQRVSKKSSRSNQLANKDQRQAQKLKLRQLSTDVRQNNPFESKFTRPKHPVLGQRLKGVKGHVGESRKRGNEARKGLAVALNNKLRVGGVVDRRFGEADANMSVEDKMLARMMKQKQTKAADFSLQVEITSSGARYCRRQPIAE